MDLDADGFTDVLSGSWPGEIFLFRGGPDRTFRAPVKIQGPDGRSLNPGGGVEKGEDGSITVTGDGEFREVDGKQVITYEGTDYPLGDAGGGITGTASVVFAHDWDGDGDLDLLHGEISGSLSLLRNEGTAKAFAFAKEVPLYAGGAPAEVAADAAPFVADWDDDGLPDLLSGSGDGSVVLFRNVGTRKEPRLAKGVAILPATGVAYGPEAPAEPRRGVRSKVCAADWNGDGRLDLLVGDFATLRPSRPEPTAEEKEEVEKARKELEVLDARLQELMEKWPKASPEERKALEAEGAEITKRQEALRAKVPPEYETHGWVWLFLRRPAAGR